MSLETRLPGWLKVANPVIVALQRRGLAVGAMHVLTVPGRRSGEPRTTPVSPLTVDGRRYIVADLEGGRLGQERAGVGRGDPRARPTRAAGRARRVAGRGACCPPAGVPARGAARGPVLPPAARRVRRPSGVCGAGSAVPGVPGRGVAPRRGLLPNRRGKRGVRMS